MLTSFSAMLEHSALPTFPRAKRVFLQVGTQLVRPYIFTLRFLLYWLAEFTRGWTPL